MRWSDTENVGRSGFVQSRLHLYPWPSEVGEIQFHAPEYSVHLYSHRLKGQDIPIGFHYFPTLDEAKAWATTVVRFATADN